MRFLTGREVDEMLKWPRNRAEKLARKGRLPHYVLPDGESIRFVLAEIEALMERHGVGQEKSQIKGGTS